MKSGHAFQFVEDDCIIVSSTATLQALKGAWVKIMLFAYFWVFLSLEDSKRNIVSKSDINKHLGVKRAGSPKQGDQM